MAVDSLGGFERSIVVRAGMDELEAVCRRLGLAGLLSLEGEARVVRTGRGRYRVDIDFRADVLQSCVVTLETIGSQVSDTGVIWFQQDRDTADEPDLLDLEAPDPPEPLLDGRIDVGELIVQHLSLALDPYPRSEGADLAIELPASDGAEADMVEGEAAGAFAVLAKLKQR